MHAVPGAALKLLLADATWWGGAAMCHLAVEADGEVAAGAGGQLEAEPRGALHKRHLVRGGALCEIRDIVQGRGADVTALIDLVAAGGTLQSLDTAAFWIS